MRTPEQAMSNAKRIKDEIPHLIQPSNSDKDMAILYEEVTRLRAELAAAKMYLPCKKYSEPHVPVKAIGKCDYAKWGIIIETDKEFAARAGQPHQEVTE